MAPRPLTTPASPSGTPGWRANAARLCHPVPLAAVLVMTANDHLLKGSGALPGVVTGKLSDVAGLFFFPLLLAALLSLLLHLGRLHASGPAVDGASVLVTGLVFAGIKLSPVLNSAVETLWAPSVRDPSDLLALPMLGLSWAWMRRSAPLRPLSSEVIAVVTAGLASLATSSPRLERVYPRWATASEAQLTLGCATVETWVARTGKQGAGVTLAARATTAPCRLTVHGSRFLVGGQDVPAPEAPATLDLSAGAERHLWLSHAFDGDSAWNEERRAAVLTLDLEAAGERRSWKVPLTLALEGDRQFRLAGPPAATRRAPEAAP